MRDFRDAKAMARTLRTALAAKGHKISTSEGLELIAQAFGVADWNTLAALNRSKSGQVAAAAGPGLAEAPTGWRRPLVNMSEQARLVFPRAIEFAKQRGHWGQFSREHFLLALTDDPDAVDMMRACGTNVDLVKVDVGRHLDGLPRRTLDQVPPGETSWNGGFVHLPAIAEAAMQGLPVATGAHILSSIRGGKGPAAQILQQRGFNRRRAWNYMRALAAEPQLPAAFDDVFFWNSLIYGKWNYDRDLKQSDRLRPTFRAAIEHAVQRGHQEVTSTHLLLALMDDPDASDLMRACGADPERLKSDVVERLASVPEGRSDGTRAKPWLEASVGRAFEIAKAMDHRRLTGRHLLLSLLSETADRAGQILRNRGMNLEQALQRTQGLRPS